MAAQFIRTCQSCGNKQPDTDPQGKAPTMAYNMRKCRRCGSSDLDYGTNKLTQGDMVVVANVRDMYGKSVESYTNKHIAEVWREFSQSEDYPDKDKFLIWLAD